MTIQSFKIGHHQYSVEYVDDLVHQGEVVNGWCHGDKKKIKVNTTDNAHSCITETLIHEVMHGIFHESSIEDDEEMVTRLSKTLHGFLKDNIDTLNEMYRKPELFISSEAISKAVARAKDGYHSTVAGESILDLKAEVSD